MEKIELSEVDLTNILAIIDIAAQKGCFKASDMATVGQLYEKIQKLNKKDPANQPVAAAKK
jgi:hypothetical protein